MLHTPDPPSPPTTISGLSTEMLGTLDASLNGLGLYQGTLRYWMMWRLPQMIDAIQSAPRLRFHLCCSSYKDLLQNFSRIYLLPDLLVLGQCGPLLHSRMLQYEHPIEHQWPVVDPLYKPGLSVIGGKFDRPVLPGWFPVLHNWVRPLSPMGGVIFAPFATMLAGANPTCLSLELVDSELDEAVDSAQPAGLPCELPYVERVERARREFEADPSKKRIPVQTPSEGQSVGDYILQNGKVREGLIALPDSEIFQFDPSWEPSDILAFEFYLSAICGSMFMVAGDWCDFVPAPGHEFKLRIPYLQKTDPAALSAMIAEEPDLFSSFRKTIAAALSQALNAHGSEAFSQEMTRIQTEVIDDGVARLHKKWDRIRRRRFERLGLYATKSVPLAIGLYTAASPAMIAALFGSVAESVYSEIEKRRAELAEVKSEPMYFIWRVGR